MPSEILAQTIPRAIRKWLKTVEVVVFVGRISEPAFWTELIRVLEIGFVPVG